MLNREKIGGKRNKEIELKFYETCFQRLAIKEENEMCLYK